MPTVTTVYTQDNIALNIRDYGGPTHRVALLGLPGITRNGKDFDAFAMKLEQAHRMLTIDFRGRGGSGWDPNYTNYHLATYVNDVLQVLTALDLHRVTLIGTSLGGLVSMGLAVARPSVINSIVINDIGPVIHTTGMEKLVQLFSNRMSFASFDEAAKAFQNAWGHAYPDEGSAFWAQFANNVCTKTKDGIIEPDYDPDIGRAVLEGIGQPQTPPWSVWKALNKIPTLLVRGALSEFLSAETAEEMALSKPDIRTCVLENRGHTPTLAEPKAFENIKAFLEDNHLM